MGGLLLFVPEGRGSGEKALPSLIETIETETERSVKLLEGTIYHFEIEGGEGLRLLEPRDVISENETAEEGKRGRSGRISTGLFTGTMVFVLGDENGNWRASAAVEVRSSKLGYDGEYRAMLTYITNQCVEATNALLALRTPSSHWFKTDFSKSADSTIQRFFFVKSLLETEDFERAIELLTEHPRRVLFREERLEDTRRVRKISGKTLCQLATGSPRMNVSTDHPLYSRLKTVPVRISLGVSMDSIDTPENRFVKYVLRDFQGFLRDVEEKLCFAGRSSDDPVLAEVTRMGKAFEGILSKGFFRNISVPLFLPLGSPVLQKKAGYREVFQAWLKFRFAAALVWEGGSDVYAAGKKDVAKLYEYWLFFVVRDLVRDVFGLENGDWEDFFDLDGDGIGLKLKSGRRLDLKGTAEKYGGKLIVRLSYNRAFFFSGKKIDVHTTRYHITNHSGGSWSGPMRPDYVLSIWSSDLSEQQAENEGTLCHIIFDAKYRVDSLERLFGPIDMADSFLDGEKIDQEKGNYRRGDLLKMHAYRDVIPGTVGAYVLYPGKCGSDLWSPHGFRGIIPGLGAFSVRPSPKGGQPLETDPLRRFLEAAARNLHRKLVRNTTNMRK